jgi:branched-chain amino acid transport system ATP-binding protein
MPILDVQRLTRRFGGLTAVDELSFSVEPGEVRGLIGPNGAGKTTTFNVISGFYAPTSGQVVYDGKDISAHLAARDSLFNTLLGRNLAREAEAEKRARETLEFFGLSDRADELASNLPHGLQRALGMAVALVAGPKLLLLDEPFTGMNPEETRHMMDLVRRVRDRGITILLVEHDMQAVMGLCDRITVLNFGQLLTEGAPDEIRLHPDVIEAYLGAAAGAA